jgi:hypothetical protein
MDAMKTIPSACDGHVTTDGTPLAALRRRLRRVAGGCVERLEERALLSAAPSLGVNIRNLGPSSGDELFADAMKEAAPWSTNLSAPSSASPAAIDANRWPKQDAGIDVLANSSDDGGTYGLSFTGRATVAAVKSETSVHVVNVAYNAASNTTTALVTVPRGATQLMLDFTSTRRLPTDTTATGITNVHLMRPNAVDSATPYAPSVIFSTPILKLLSNFSSIRFMDYSLTNYNPQVNWSDRTLPAQVQTNGKGGAWEYAVALGNQTNEDVWINIPEMATNDYITKLAQLIDFGSDGVNPYTGPRGSAISADNPNPVPAGGPVWAGLNPNLHVYVEYSNEVWNTGFSQSQQNLAAAIAEVNAGNSPLNYDGDALPSDWAVRRTAERIVETSNLFRAVFGDSQMSEVRPVYEWQYNNLNDTAALGLNFINDYYDNGDGIQHVADPHPVNYYLWGGGGGWYGKLSNVNGTGDVIIPGAIFATPAISAYKADPTGATWAFSGTAGIAANGSSLGNPAAAAGSQAAYVQGTGSFSEVVNFSGGMADLTFGAASTSTESVQVLIDGKAVYGGSGLGKGYVLQRTAVFDTGASPGPHTVTFTGTGKSGSVFVSNVVAETINGMFNSNIQDISSTSQSEAAWAAAFGIQMAGYEGGFTFGTGSSGDALQNLANLDPRAEQADIAQMNEFYASGGALAMYYDTTDAIAALTLDINNQNTSKIKAVQSVVAAPQPALNYGTVLPTKTGSSVMVANSLGVDAGAAGLYPLDVTTPGTYNVTLTGLQSGAAIEQFLLDGQAIPGIASLPADISGNSAPALTFTITTPGLHALLLNISGSGTVTPNNPAGPVIIAAGAGPDLPAAPSEAPADASASMTTTGVNLSWTPLPDASGYQIRRSTDGVNFKIIGAADSGSFTDPTTAPATYTYEVVPYDSGGFGPGFTCTPVVVSTAAEHLVFTAQPPATATAGTPIGSSGGVKVSVEDAAGKVVAGDSSLVTLMLQNGLFPNGGTTVSAQAVNGVAAFSNLVIGRAGSGYAGTGYTFAATDGLAAPAVSSAFKVVAGPVSLLQSLVTFSGAALALGDVSIVTLQARDAEGNQLPAGGLKVAFKLAGTGTSAGTFSSPIDYGNGTYTATFTATAAGTARQITATVGGSAITSSPPSITVTSAPYTAAPAVFRATQGRSATGTVAAFTVPNVSAPASNFTATINWGDSAQNFPGTIIRDGGGAFHVTASHAYSALSPTAGFAIKVTIMQAGSVVAKTTSTGVVTPSSLAALTLAAIGTPVNTTLTNKVVASFQDNNPLQTLATTYTGTINWGDGVQTAATIKFASSKAGVASYWNVLGTHKYVKKGTFTVTATISEPAAKLTVTLKTVIDVV